MISDLQEYMIKHRKTLAVAESCTGGFLAHLITIHPGASEYFLGSFVTYCDQLKHAVLGVEKSALEECGAVSATVALQMLEGVFRVAKSDFAIAITGVAGPGGGSEEKPVGTVWIAIGEKKQEPKTFKMLLEGDRSSIIKESAQLALGFLYQHLRSGEGK